MMKTNMARTLLAFGSVCIGVAAWAGTVQPQAAPSSGAPASAQDAQKLMESVLADRNKVISYAIGVVTARNLAKDQVEYDPSVVALGMADARKGSQLMLDEQQITAVMSDLMTEMRQNLAKDRQQASEKNRKAGDAYRAKIAKEPDTKTLANGILYKVWKQGAGARPLDSAKVQVHYRGTLISGVEFQAAIGDKPVSLEVGKLIPGLKAAIEQMPIGSKWTIIVPPDQAYGARGVGTAVGPNETLIFIIELLAIG